MIAFTGDGSLTMIMGELATLAQHKLPVKVVVMKNNTLGLIKWEQMLYLGNPEYGVDLHPVTSSRSPRRAACAACASTIRSSAATSLAERWRWRGRC